MKTMTAAIVVLVALVGFLVIELYASDSAAVRAQRRAADEAQRAHRLAEDVIDGVRYVKDARTNLCFAYYYNGLATVPCEAIPPHMLTTVK